MLTLHKTLVTRHKSLETRHPDCETVECQVVTLTPQVSFNIPRVLVQDVSKSVIIPIWHQLRNCIYTWCVSQQYICSEADIRLLNSPDMSIDTKCASDTRHQTATVYQLHQQTTMCSFLQEESVFDKYKSDKPMDIVLPRWVNGCLIQIQIQIQIQIHEKRKTTCGYCSSKVSPHEAGGWWGRCCLTVHLQQHHHDDDDDDGWSNDDSDDASPALWLPSHRSVSEKKK